MIRTEKLPRVRCRSCGYWMRFHNGLLIWYCDCGHKVTDQAVRFPAPGDTDHERAAA